MDSQRFIFRRADNCSLRPLRYLHFWPAWGYTINTYGIKINVESYLIYSSNQSDILALDHYSSQRSWCASFGSDFVGFIEYNVHELIEAEDFTFQSDFVVIEEPYFNSGLVLQKSEYDCQGIDTFWLTFFRHLSVDMMDRFDPCLWILYKLNINPLISY